MIRRLLVIAVCFSFLCLQVPGQVRSPQNEAQRHIVAVRSILSGGEVRFGCGILVGQQDESLVVLTARHVIFNDESGEPAKRIDVLFERDDEWVTPDRVVAEDEATDLAALAIGSTKTKLDLGSLFSSLRVATPSMLRPGSGKALGVADRTGTIQAIELELRGESGGIVRFAGAVRKGYSGGGLFTEDWYFAGLVHSRGGAGDDHEASSFTRLAAFCKQNSLPFGFSAMPALGPLVRAQADERSAILFMWKQNGPTTVKRDWLRLHLTQRSDNRFGGEAFAKRKTGPFTLSVDGDAGRLSVPNITDLGRLSQLDFRLETEDVLPGFAVYRLESNLVQGDLAVPVGEARILLEDIIGKVGTNEFIANAGGTGTVEKLHRYGDRPPLIPIYLQIYKQNWNINGIPVPVPISMREHGIKLVGRLSFNKIFFKKKPKEQGTLLNSRLVVLGEDRGTELAVTSVPGPGEPLDFEFTIPRPEREIILCARGEKGGRDVRVVIECLRMLPLEK